MKERNGLWLVNISKYATSLADKQIHTYCSAPHVVNTCSFYCFWKNLTTQHIWRKTTWSPISVEDLSIKFFLLYLVVSTSKWARAKLIADWKTVRLQFSTFQFLKFLKAQQQYWWMIFSYFSIKWYFNTKPQLRLVSCRNTRLTQNFLSGRSVLYNHNKPDKYNYHSTVFW